MNSIFGHHTIHQFDEELKALHNQIIEMGELVLNQLCLSLESVKYMDLSLAQGIIDREKVVDEMEVSADKTICAILVRRCPKGSDLRQVLSASKIVNCLEQIGDKVVKLANFVVLMHTTEQVNTHYFSLEDIYRLGGVSTEIVQSALEAFEDMDVEQARQVVQYHLTLDQEFQKALHHLIDFLQAEKSNVNNTVSQVLMMKALERIGEHARQIAELVIYQLEGQEPTHHLPDLVEDFPVDGL
jgi:phosphate transport system protein